MTLSVCVYIIMCRMSCRIACRLFAHSQWLPLANLFRLSGVEGFEEGECAPNKANQLMCSGNHKPKLLS